jgi:hypothetical protein
MMWRSSVLVETSLQYDAFGNHVLSRDPIKDGRNWYVYCDGNPVAFADPTGLLLYVAVLADLVAEAEPPRPPGASVRVNTVRLRTVIAHHPREEAVDWWKENVTAGGPWDYHTRFGDAYDAFGNFNYGYTGAFLGYPLPVLLRAAGYASQRRAGKSLWRCLQQVFGPPPYGDDSLEDQYWIRRGYEQFQKDAELYYPDGDLFSSGGGVG